VFGGSSNYGGGTLDNVAGRVGFVFKIGKITPTSNQAISQKAEKLESQLSEVKQENQKLTGYLEEMKKLIAMQNDRLSNLEKVAMLSGDQRTTAQFNKKTSSLEIANASE
jgi:predicted RNase H-like nuclease (RuvC/YqgF family)